MFNVALSIMNGTKGTNVIHLNSLDFHHLMHIPRNKNGECLLGLNKFKFVQTLAAALQIRQSSKKTFPIGEQQTIK